MYICLHTSGAIKNNRSYNKFVFVFATCCATGNKTPSANSNSSSWSPSMNKTTAGYLWSLGNSLEESE